MSDVSTPEQSKTSQEQHRAQSNEVNEKSRGPDDVEHSSSGSKAASDIPEPVVTVKTWLVCVVSRTIVRCHIT